MPEIDHGAIPSAQENLPPVPDRGPITIPLIERQGQVSAINDLLRRGLSGSGQLALIQGPAGIGKTRLLEETHRLALDFDAEVLSARGGELEQGHPLGLVLRLLEHRISKAPDDELPILFRGQAGFLKGLLTVGWSENTTAVNDEFALMHSLYWLVVNLADRKPLVLLVDDLQWADEQSLRFFLYLAQRLQDLPVVLAATVRSGDPAAENDLFSHLMLQADLSLRLQELTVDGVRQFLQASLPPESQPAGSLIEETWSATRGNLFLLREVASTLKTRQAGLRSESVPVDTAPDKVARSVMLRISALGADAVALARAVSVLGTSTSLAVAAQVAGLAHDAAITAVERLSAAQILAADPELSFHHPLIRSAVYYKFSADERAAAHLAAAQLLHRSGARQEDVALHLMLAAPVPEDWATTSLHAAARSAGQKGAPATAARFLRRALEAQKPEDAADARLLVDLGMMEAAAGETEALTHLERALERLDGPAERALAMYALGQTLFRYGRSAEALTVFRRGADDFASHDRELSLRFEAGYIASAAYLFGRAREAFDRVKTLTSEPEANDISTLSPAERLLVLHLAVFRAMSEPGSAQHAALALRVLGDGLQLWRETSDGMALSHTVLALTWCGAPREAIAVADKVLTDARLRGDSLIFAEISLARGLAMYARGRVDEAMADAQAAVIGMSRGWNSTVPAPQGLLAYCHLDRGEIDEAAEVLKGAENGLRDEQTRVLNVWFYMGRGRLRLAQNDFPGALDDFLQAGELLESNGYSNPGYMLLPWRALAAFSAHKLGRTEDAQILVDQDIDLAERFGLPSALGASIRYKALIADPAPDIDLLQKSVIVLDTKDPSLLELATSLLELGAAQRRVGERVRCRNTLRRALDLAHQAGATAIEKRAHEELLAAGARPRRPLIQGPNALTPSEQRIADLMAEGMTSRQIAEQLYLTLSTVEWHRRNIYRKLDVNSRHALKAALTGQPLDAEV